MCRLFSAVTEWLQLRARLREERQFHIDCAEADFRNAGLSEREARRRARLSFGRHSLRDAAIELGCDLSGLAVLIRTNRVLASTWLQPITLIATIALSFLLSPEPRELVGSVLIRVHRLENKGATILNLDDGSGWYTGTITGPEFSALQSMTTLTSLERYRGSYAWGKAAHGATLSAIAAEARRISGNSKIVAESVGPQWELLANPEQSAWLVVGCCAVLLLLRYVFQFTVTWRHLWRWLLYGIALATLHAAASLAAWALLLQIWHPTRLGAPFVVLFLAWSGIAAGQCRGFWIDLRSRCPLCLQPMVLPLTEGAGGSMILRPAITESVCAHGHGVLVESRWNRMFRPEESPIESLANFS